MEIKNYIPERYKLVYGSLSDILAVKAGIKPVARLMCNKEDHTSIKRAFENEGLKIEISEKPFGSQYFLYLSKSIELIKKAKKCDNSFNYQNMSGEELSRSIKEFGALLGYPECCTKFLADNMHLPAKDVPEKFIPDKGINFLFNNLLNSFSNLWLSFHQPCSYNCPKSKEYLKKIYDNIKKEEPDFKNELDRYLKCPYLVIFNLNLPLSNAWETRKGFRSSHSNYCYHGLHQFLEH